MSRALEAARQSELLAALFGSEPDARSHALEAARCAERGERARRGLEAYRAAAASTAERALAAAYPTFCALVGSEDAAAVARALWNASPPRQGDLGRWARDLPEFIEAEPDFDAWPYLADCARLDAAVARCESATDADADLGSFALLSEQPPEALRVILLPSVQLLRSAWPVATLHAAHRPQAPAGALAQARMALQSREGEAIVVARRGWVAVPTAVDRLTWLWMQALHERSTLAEALQRVGAGFDFEAWLVQALSLGWLWRAVSVEPDAPERAATAGAAGRLSQPLQGASRGELE